MNSVFDLGEDDVEPIKGFAKLPNSVVRDAKLEAADLVLLCHRLTFVDDERPWGINASDLSAICRGPGNGRAVGQRAIAKLRNFEYIERTTRKTNDGKTIGGNSRSAEGAWKFSTDTLTTKATFCGASGNAWHAIYRAQFAGRLSVDEHAAFLFLQAGLGPDKGPITIRDISKRFGWSKPNARKVLNGERAKGKRPASPGLKGLGLLRTWLMRDEKGKLSKHCYTAVAVDWRLAPKDGAATPMGKNLSNGFLSNGNSTNTRTSYLSPASPTEQPLTRPINRESRFSEKSAETFDFGEMLERALGHHLLLGALYDEDPACEEMRDQLPVTEESWNSINAVLSEGRLKAAIQRACFGRIAPELITPEGLFSVVWLAAYRMHAAEALSPPDAEAALQVILQDIADASLDRDGKRRYINSLGLLVKRIAGDTYGGNDASERIYSNKVLRTKATVRPKPTSGGDPYELKKLRERDQGLGRILAPILFSQHNLRKLENLLKEFGRDLVLDEIRSIILRGAIGDRKVGVVETWNFFRKPIQQRLRCEDMAARGERPGDVFRAHKA